jgi:hypothetical protein
LKEKTQQRRAARPSKEKTQLRGLEQCVLNLWLRKEKSRRGVVLVAKERVLVAEKINESSTVLIREIKEHRTRAK